MKTGAINIYSANLNVADFELSLNQLLLNGWSANKKGSIVYIMDDSYEPLSIPYTDDNFNILKREMYANIENDIITALDLVYRNNEAVIGLYFVNDGDDKSIMITMPEDVICIDGIEIVHFSWYLDKIKSIFSIFNFYRLTCSFD